MNIHIRVKTKARTSKVEKVDDTHFIVWTHTAPEKGKANHDIIKQLSAYFDVSQSRILITSGHTSRNKTVSIALA